ncbi:ionotropic receptor 75a-like [Epargyreus clarus]|uniref:ionotropic receptor 75a-like n=1 Tax=Epargyreus clarus TaxID=520877 RepID=UPI003C2C43F9
MDTTGLHHFVGFLSSAFFLTTADIFKFKNINDAVVFQCNDNKYSMFLQKAFQSQDIRLQTVDIGPNTTYEMPQTNLKIGMVINTSCNSWETIFFEANKIKNRFSWILQTEELSLVVNSLSQYPIEINSDITIMSKNGNTYLLHEIFNMGLKGGRLVVRNIGHWDSSLHIKVQRRSDLSGVVLDYVVVVTENLENETFQHFVEHSGSGRFEVDNVHKFKSFTMLSYIRDMYNFRYRLIRTNSWGYVRNGSFEGLVGILQRSGADVGGSAIFVRADRARAVDYVAETWQFKPQFVLRQPKYPGGFYSIYTGPLSKTVWYCVIGLLFLIALIMVLALKQKIILAHCDEEDNPNTLTFLFIFSAVSQQGISINRSSNSVKIIVFVTFLFTLTLYQYYTATVVSTLLREPPRVIKTLKDLLHSNFEAGAEDVLYNKDYFKHTTDPIARQLYKKKIVTSTHRSYLSPDDGMALVKRGGFAYLVDTCAAYNRMRKTFTETEICDTQEVALYPPQSMGAVVRKGLPYKEHFAYGIRKLYECGLMRRLQSVWDAPRPPCVRTPDASALSVRLAEFSTALVLLLAGMAAAIVILIGEIFVFRFNKRRHHKTYDSIRIRKMYGCVRTPDASALSVRLAEFSTALVLLMVGMATAIVILIGEIIVFRFNKRSFRI